ncbi:DUF3298 and DUF4163 domain-containing protein [Henriciella litoralis]|uniref:DUF3298 and DUF4163 domain-containing protein n=1 Tax=Henriciella litoralis TaxID=568102 RepID=UPI000A068EA2|nr:DUF3298 and DUF4163 domain-containing protein [Henriciella litoralis]
MRQYSILLIAALAGVTAGCADNSDSANEPVRVSEIERPETSTATAFSQDGGGIAIVNGNEAASIDIDMPADLAEFDPKLADTLRARVNELTEGFAESAEQDMRDAAEKNFTFRPNTLEISWVETGPESGPLQSFLGTSYSYQGGAHPTFSYQMLNWDTDANRELGFEDLFEDADSARTAVIETLKSSLIEQKRERFADDFTEEDILDSWIEPAFEAPETKQDRFTFATSSDPAKSGGLIYHFGPYEVGSYAEGAYTVGVPASIFAAFLKPAYSDNFGGEMQMPKEDL